jgi:hypothetical protein
LLYLDVNLVKRERPACLPAYRLSRSDNTDSQSDRLPDNFIARY